MTSTNREGVEFTALALDPGTGATQDPAWVRSLNCLCRQCDSVSSVPRVPFSSSVQVQWLPLWHPPSWLYEPHPMHVLQCHSSGLMLDPAWLQFLDWVREPYTPPPLYQLTSYYTILLCVCVRIYTLVRVCIINRWWRSSDQNVWSDTALVGLW